MAARFELDGPGSRVPPASTAAPAVAAAVVAALLACGGPGCALEPAHEADRGEGRAWRGRIDVAARAGPARGFLQVPAGGKPGTATKGRPRLSELGIDDLFTVRTVATGEVERVALRLDAWLVRGGASETLHDGFLLRRQPFARGERVRTSFRFDVYRLALGYRFTPADGLDVTPLAGFGLLDFGLDVSGDRRHRGRRSFRSGSPQLGVEASLALTERLALDFTVLGTPGPGFETSVGSGDLVLRWRVLGDEDSPALELFGGPAIDIIDFEDSQRLPNHLRILLAPEIAVGLSVRF